MTIPTWQRYFLWSLFLAFSSCIDPYEPNIISGSNSYLVVDGFINSNGPTVFRLSRSQNLSEGGTPPALTQAAVYVEEEGGRRMVLVHAGNGVYRGNNLAVATGKQYRLFIQADGKEYASDFVPVKIAPPIDSVSWKQERDGVQVYVSTHDSQQQTRYYRWDYAETFEFTSAYYSSLEYVNGRVQDRRDNINRCWRTIASTDINIGTTVRLSEDRMQEAPLLFTRLPSVKYNYRYSILVRQYAMTRESYQYWETLKKNTKNIGSLFDPLPTQLTGNITCLTDTREPVLGFVSASSVTEKRLFISAAALKDRWTYFNEYTGCDQDTISPNEVRQYFTNPANLPTYALTSEMGDIIGYVYSSSYCVDCRLQGTNIKPAYWP